MMAEVAVRVRILGVGMGPQHVTPEVAEALRSVDYVLAADRSLDDRCWQVRREICPRTGTRRWSPSPTRSATGRPGPDYRGLREGRRRLARGAGGGVRAGAAASAAATRRSWCGATRRSTTRPSGSSSQVRALGVATGVRRAARHQRPAAAGRPAPDRAARGRPAGARHHRTAAARRRSPPGSDNIVAMLNRGRLDLDRAGGLDDLVGRQPRARGRAAGQPAGSATSLGDIAAARARPPRTTAGWVMDMFLVRTSLMAGLLVAGTTSDAGKSVVTTGLCRALARRGVQGGAVQGAEHVEQLDGVRGRRRATARDRPGAVDPGAGGASRRRRPR